ncbi:MAG TPA: Wzz/FepE/Etk N-terminal domain-containing protein [Chloroflexia bacterium]|nr:Wzz/FepE/Etk N-terminal domain-containing protein [Chloroflexia bacterium]
MEVRTYLGIILRYWWVVLLLTLAAGGSAAALVSIRTPSYTTHARVVARPSTTLTETREIVDMLGQMGTRQLSGTFAQAFTSAQVKAEARQEAGLSEADAADYPLEANVLPDTTVIEISGKGPDPVVLAKYLNATVQATVSSTKELFRVMDLVPLEAAAVPAEPTSPQPMRDIPLGAGLGFGLGIMLALAIDYLRGGSRTPEMQLRALPPHPTQLERLAVNERRTEFLRRQQENALPPGQQAEKYRE